MTLQKGWLRAQHGVRQTLRQGFKRGTFHAHGAAQGVLYGARFSCKGLTARLKAFCRNVAVASAAAGCQDRRFALPHARKDTRENGVES